LCQRAKPIGVNCIHEKDGEHRETQIDYFFRNSPSLDFGRSDCPRKEEAY
jgi:hypothetical protein